MVCTLCQRYAGSFRNIIKRDRLYGTYTEKSSKRGAGRKKAVPGQACGIGGCSIETGQFNPTAKLALILCIALDKKFEELFYFE